MTVTNLLIGVLVVGLLIYRQFQKRPVRSDFRLPLILAIIGIFELVSFLKKNHLDGTIALALLGSLVLAGVFGGLRALTTRVWIEDGQAWRQGGVLTSVLWIITVAAHLGYDYLVDKHSNLGNDTILLYLAVSFAIQRVILQARVQRLPGGPTAQSAGDRDHAAR